jgi:nucleotide-binding universal stress UspA family protein
MSTLPELKRILYATDLGKHTRPVFRHAVSLAKHYGAELIMLHVVAPIGATGQAVIDTYLSDQATEELEREGMRRILEQMRTRLERFTAEEMDAVEGETASVSKLLVMAGNAAETIVRAAEENQVDMIVMGTCTHSIFGRSLMGSTARQVTQHTRIPVMVVPNC